MDTHLPYMAGQYAPFLCEVTTDTVEGEVGINYFGWNLLELPFAGVCVRYARDGLPPMAWGFCAHHGDLVDVYETDLLDDGGVKKYKWEENSWVALTPREKITIEYPSELAGVSQYYDINEVYETIHHGPVVLCRDQINKVYAFRGCWDLDGREYQQSLNIVREL
jgi:hypothetical protein